MKTKILDIDKSLCLQKGINVHKLKTGTMVLVVTKNNLYKIIKQDGGEQAVTLQGGKYYLEPTSVFFTGSTLGGTMLKIGWIGYGMKMEFFEGTKKLSTSSVMAAKVVGDGWEYNMDWTHE